MKAFWVAYVMAFLFGLGLVAVFGQSDEAYPGQSQHQMPPKDWFCSPTDARPEHVCHCKRMDYTDPVCDSPPDEDKTCTVWCHAQACRCPIVCKTPSEKPHE